VPLSADGAEIRLPAVPAMGNKWRLLSGLLAVSLLVGLIMLSQASFFQVEGIQIEGLENFTESEISQAINIKGSSIFFINPELVKEDLRLTYPALSEITVKLSWPARVLISLEERSPVLAWNWDGHVRWVDEKGVAFEPHHQGVNLIQVNSAVLPPTIENRFVDPRIVDTVSVLSPLVPEGGEMIFDPDHGLGWQDHRGWVVYFGFNDDDAQQKMKIYQALIGYLEGKRITPRVINVEHVESPYFRMEQ
jgi:cell division septal protein FtsQ